METNLLLAGTAFFALCTLAFWRAAFRASVGWGVAGVLIPPSAIFYYAVFWSGKRLLALVHFTSLLMFVLVAVVWVRANPGWFDHSRLAPLRDWLAPASASTPLALQPVHFIAETDIAPYLKQNLGSATARFDGQTLDMVRTTFIDGTLRFKSDETLFSTLEVSIPLQGISLRAGENLLQYTPESTDNPPVIIARRSARELAPAMEIIEHGFWLELMITTTDTPVYHGYIKLRLPDAHQSFLAGDYRAYTRDVRILDDAVDRFFDSSATIEYVAEQYLINTLGHKLEKVTGFRNTFVQTALDDATARTEATVLMADGREHTVKFSLLKGDSGWVVKSAPELDLISALRVLRQNPPAAIGQTPLRDRLRSIDPQAVESALGQEVVILTLDGKQREGRVSAVDQHNITLAAPVEGGAMAMLVKRREVMEVQIRDRRQLPAE